MVEMNGDSIRRKQNPSGHGKERLGGRAGPQLGYEKESTCLAIEQMTAQHSDVRKGENRHRAYSRSGISVLLANEQKRLAEIGQITHELTGVQGARIADEVAHSVEPAFLPQKQECVSQTRQEERHQARQKVAKNLAIERASHKVLKETGAWVYVPELKYPQSLWLLQGERSGIKPPRGAFIEFIDVLFELFIFLIRLFSDRQNERERVK